jgi:hypothetical protein
MIRSGLDMAGHRVLEAAHPDEAIRIFGKQPLDAVLAPWRSLTQAIMFLLQRSAGLVLECAGEKG